ncbi:MAG: SPFH domain-containing protein [Lentisphaeraceae bacterium]|nr:SPFH domain-containing protein [Lentisphaeraceae bacterium]
MSAIFGAGTIFIAGWTRTHIAQLLLFAGVNTFLFSLLIFNFYRLKFRSEVEEEEQVEVRKSTGASKELFDDSDEALMLSSRALKTWNNYVLPVLTLVYGVGALIYLVMKWMEWVGSVPVNPKTQMAASACAGALGVCYFLIGAFYGGAAKQKGGLGLRAFSAWAYFTSILCVAVMAVMFFAGAQYPELDKIVSRVFLVVFMILAFELSLNFLIDMYRPRFHTEEKSILESRFLSIFTDSGSIASNIAHALDYQFGLKVTEEGFYRFLKKGILPLLLIQVGTLYLLSSFTLIETGHRGLKESFGKIDPTNELGPGLYLTLPYPMTKIHTFPADKISSIEVGQKPKIQEAMPDEPGDEQEAVTVTEDVELWSKKGHHSEGMEEIKYIITTNSRSATDSTSGVNLITVVVPIHYRIKAHKAGEESPLYHYLFGHANAKRMLYAISSEVVMKYLSLSDYYDFLGKDREVAAENLHKQIQASADQHKLGVEIVALALESTHPPGEVSKSYDDVMAAEYDKEKHISEANVQEVNIKSAASINEKNITAAAKGEIAEIDYKDESGKTEKVPMKIALAKEKAIRLKTQQESFNSQPYLFSLINYLSVLENGLQHSKLIIIDGDKADYNFRFDLKPKIIPDFNGLEIPEAK